MNEIILDDPGLRAVDIAGDEHKDVLSSVRYALGAVWNRRRLAIGISLAVFSFVIGFALMIPRHYAEAMLVIHPEHDNLAQPTTTQDNLLSDSAVDTEVEVLRSPAVAEAVVRKLRLYDDPDFGGRKDAAPTEYAIQKAVSGITGGTRVRRIGLTYAIEVGFVASSTRKAKRIADALVAAYMQRKLDQKLAAVSRANHELGQALGSLRDQALDAESRVEEYVAKNRLLDEQGTSASANELTALNQRIADAEADSAEKQARVVAAINQSRHGGGGSDIGATLASATIGALRTREADISSTLAQLQAQFGPEYPAVQKTQAELNDLRRQLQSETGRIVSSLRADADAASRREASLLASRQQVEDQIETTNKARVGLLALRQSADSTKTIYETYLKRASEVTAERGLQQVDATVESAAVPKTISPITNFKFIAAAALLISMIGSVLAVLLADLWTPRIRSLNDVTRETHLPLAGIVPDVKAFARSNDAATHISDNPLTAVAESYRHLTAYLSVRGDRSRSKVVAAASSVPGEGKTILSICLARTYAASGSKVVLLDCDLRRSRASEHFPKSRYGIAEIIEQGVPIEKALIRERDRGIWFLRGYASDEGPIDLFSRDRLAPLLEKLSEQFDHIVIDTPPLLGSADARILVTKADQVLFLIEWNKTPASIVRTAADILRQSNAHVAGVVLNKVNVRQQSLYGFADGSDYYHRYGAIYPKAA